MACNMTMWISDSLSVDAMALERGSRKKGLYKNTQGEGGVPGKSGRCTRLYKDDTCTVDRAGAQASPGRNVGRGGHGWKKRRLHATCVLPYPTDDVAGAVGKKRRLHVTCVLPYPTDTTWHAMDSTPSDDQQVRGGHAVLVFMCP